MVKTCRKQLQLVTCRKIHALVSEREEPTRGKRRNYSNSERPSRPPSPLRSSLYMEERRYRLFRNLKRLEASLVSWLFRTANVAGALFRLLVSTWNARSSHFQNAEFRAGLFTLIQLKYCSSPDWSVRAHPSLSTRRSQSATPSPLR